LEEIEAMKTSAWRDEATTASHGSVRKDRHPDFVWNFWCVVAVAAAVWLILFGLALFALSAMAGLEPASSRDGSRPSAVVAPGGSEMHASSARSEIWP
jgi:hypothetical protein